MPELKTIVHQWDQLAMIKNTVHPNLYQKQLMMPLDADRMQTSLHAVLFERLEEKGAVLPHTHDCCEVICITKGQVEAYYQGSWHHHKAGDTIIVPAQEIHSVYNHCEDSAEQISIFLPVGKQVSNRMFSTEIIDTVELPDMAKEEEKP